MLALSSAARLPANHRAAMPSPPPPPARSFAWLCKWQHTVLHLRTKNGMFENQRKSLIQYGERSELPLHFVGTKVNQKWSIWATFLKI